MTEEAAHIHRGADHTLPGRSGARQVGSANSSGGRGPKALRSQVGVSQISGLMAVQWVKGGEGEMGSEREPEERDVPNGGGRYRLSSK